MNPRQIVLSIILAFGLLAAPLPSDGQQPAKVYRIGYFGATTAPKEQTPQHCPIKGGRLWQAFGEGLREHGYIVGQNLVLECRWTEGRDERAPALAAELVSLKPDLIIVEGTAQVRAAKQANSEIPIVMVGVIEPVRRGLVASLAHPGGNVTGLTDTVGVEIMGKYVQLLKEAVPKVSRVAVLTTPTSDLNPRGIFRSEMEEAARALDVKLQFYGVREPEELEGAFAAIKKARAEALLVVPSWLLTNLQRRIADFAAQSRLPAVYPFRYAPVEAGGLMSYAIDEAAIYRRIGFYVDTILSGANPGDLAVEQPTKFELIINLQTAKALGLTIPRSLLTRADEVIQ
jgi:putative ABC transport system substrate-binding protein